MRFEMLGEFGEERDARGGVEFVAADERLQGEARFGGGDALAQARFEVRMLAQRVEFSREQLIEIGLGVFRRDGRRWYSPRDRRAAARAG